MMRSGLTNAVSGMDELTARTWQYRNLRSFLHFVFCILYLRVEARRENSHERALAKVAAIFIADTARLANCESERGGGHKARSMRAVDSYVYARGWRVFLFLCVSKDALVIALRVEKHERGTKTMTAPQPSEVRRRAQIYVAMDCKLSGQCFDSRRLLTTELAGQRSHK